MITSRLWKLITNTFKWSHGFGLGFFQTWLIVNKRGEQYSFMPVLTILTFTQPQSCIGKAKHFTISHQNESWQADGKCQPDNSHSPFHFTFPNFTSERNLTSCWDMSSWLVSVLISFYWTVVQGVILFTSVIFSKKLQLAWGQVFQSLFAYSNCWAEQCDVAFFYHGRDHVKTLEFNFS